MEKPEVIEIKEIKQDKKKVKQPQQKKYVIPKIGLRNKAPYPVHVVLKDSDTLLQVGQATHKEFLENEIISVERMDLQKAVAKGLITIIR